MEEENIENFISYFPLKYQKSLENMLAKLHVTKVVSVYLKMENHKKKQKKMVKCCEKLTKM